MSNPVLIYLVFGLVLAVAVSLHFWSQRRKKFCIGFSQYNCTLPWEQLFAKELRAEAAKYPEVELVYADSKFSPETQIMAMEDFIRRKVSLILLAPCDAVKLVPAVEKAYQAGIPVILLDRSVHSEKFTSYIHADMHQIGQAAGSFAAESLKGKGTIVEILGAREEATAELHDGFHKVIREFPNLKVVAEAEGLWQADEAKAIMQRILSQGERVDLVYAHDDPMALGAWAAAREIGQEKNIKFIGVNAEPGLAGGCQAVADGKLEATFLYATPGAEGIKQALKLLHGGTIPKRIPLSTVAVVKDFALQYANR